MAKILVADDEAGLRSFMQEALELDGHSVAVAADGDEAERMLAARGFDLLITDLKMPRQDGLTLLAKVRAEQPELEVVVLTAHATVDSAVTAMRLGAFDYLQKPIGGPDELCLVARRALERRQLLTLKAGVERSREAQQPRLSHGDPAMAPVVTAIEKVARTQATVLLLGASGTGKEVAARTLHALSDRRDGPFMAVNCAALAETLLESELFGHERGAFTGASERRRGRLELAEGGTFFLDEVGELKLELQAKLLRVLQERRFERVGGSRTIECDVRFVAATNRDLRTAIAQGRFREDLYHRLSLFPIRLPALRERKVDLIPLARSLLARIAADMGRPPLELTADAEARLLAWEWPGNVRELANVLERSAILADGPRLQAEQLWLDIDAITAPAAPSPSPPASTSTPTPALATLADIERDAIERTLRSVDGNRRRAAEILEIGERTLYDKLKRYGIEG